MNNVVKTTIAFIVAVLISGILGSIFQTQLNMAELKDFGPPISFNMRLNTTLADLQSFAPIYLAIILATFLVTFACAEFIARVSPGHRLLWLTFGAVVGLALAFQVIDFFAPMPTFIAATRGTGGTLIMLLAAAIGALAYTLMTPHLNSGEDALETD